MDVSTSPKRGRLIVIGLGNELVSDDGIGIRVVRELKQRIPSTDVVFEELSVGGFQLLEEMMGFEQCVIVDALLTGTHPAGTLLWFVQKAGDVPVRLASSHQVQLPEVLSLAKLLRADVPESVVVYGIEASDITTFGKGCTEEVSKAIPTLVELICRDLLDRENGPMTRSALGPEAGSTHGAGNWQVLDC